MNTLFGRTLSLILLAFGLALSPGQVRAAENFLWLEGEQPASINLKLKPEGVGRPHFLSSSNWLKVSIDADKVEKEVPAEGILINYNCPIARAGDYEVWHRIGYEFVRSPYEWRFDNGEWTKVTPEDLTTDLMELSFFTEVAWLKAGKKPLSAGEHTLQFRLSKTKDAKGKTARILFTLDAICLHGGTFHPNGRFHPGQSDKEPLDLDAAKQVFAFPVISPITGAALPLNGLWEICRHDEQTPGETAAPIQDFPAEPHWRGIQVPGDKNKLRPDLVFAHRLWYRARISIPAANPGQSFYLVFPQNNLNTTVYVNGVYCGFEKNPFARAQIDVTRGIKPGLNEIWVGIKDAWYGYSANPNNPLKLRKKFNLPEKVLGDGFQDLAYPIWGHAQSGILVTPELVAAGSVYTADVFCKPSVANKELQLEVTLKNNAPQGQSGELLCEAFRETKEKGGWIEKSFAPKSFTLGAGEEATLNLAEKWENPKLWWPQEPNLYRLRTSVKLAGKEVDVRETVFGFREWGSKGMDFTLNGLVWHGWADVFTAPNKEDWLKFYKEKNETTMRFWGTSWQGMPPEQALDFFDRGGVVVRRSGMLDGEGIGYMAVENDSELKKESPIKMELMRHWRDQVVAQVKGERNHPAVMLWSIENEWLYINCINLYANLMDRFEAEVLKVSEAVRAADPTRLTMTDGGAANKDNAMPVHGNHYVWDTKNIPRYPGLAYEDNPAGGGRGRWVWDLKHPRFIGEDYYISGNHPELSYFNGEAAFTGKAGVLPGAGLAARILTEGYRWANCGAFHFWMGQGDTDGNLYHAFAPRAVFCRQWDWSFGSGQKVKRSLGIFNDTTSSEPISFTWSLTVHGQKVSGKTTQHSLAPGLNEKFDLELEMPKLNVGVSSALPRAEGELALALGVQGTEVFQDSKAVSILNPQKPQNLSILIASDLLLFDPQGSISAYLKTGGLGFTALPDLKNLPSAGKKILILGKDALAASESSSTALAAFALGGGRVIVLEQKHPLKYQGLLPAEMDAAANEGRTAFGEDLEHPALRGLQQKDFFTWGPEEIVYRNAYMKPARGAKSLIQCHELLQYSGLVEVPVGEGLMLLCQMVVGEKIADNAVAQQLLWNLIDYAAGYRLEFRQVSAAVNDAPQLVKVLDAVGLKHTKTDSPLQALDSAGAGIAVVAATPGNLKVLAENLSKVKQFTARGGWIVFNGLTPEGMADYNKVVGYDHMLRPFRRERVTFPAARNHLTAGLTAADVALYAAERIFPWQDGNYVASDIFSYVVDYDEVAPFARFENDFALNVVNGMVSADAWKYIYNVPAPATPPLDLPMAFPSEQELVEMEWIGNTFYYPVTKVQLFFDGKEAEAARFDTKPNNEPQIFAINPPLKGKKLTVRMADWEKIPGKSAVTGLDNLRLKARRTPEFYQQVKPLLNVGGLMEYPRGTGGILLCNLLFKDSEEVPLNLQKKRTIFTTLLRNLKAPFSGGKTIIAGAHLNYQPIDLSKFATQFRDEKGWYGDKNFTFAALPSGRQRFAGVTYDVFDFATSPVPTVLMLGAGGKLPSEIRGIPVNRKADALFFLQTAKLEARMSERDWKEKKKFETLRYVVHYRDGSSTNIPVYAEIDIHDYKQKTATPIAGAQVAWTRAYEGTGYEAVAYSKQWNNPRPEAEIQSIDMIYGEQKRGAPVLIALTAATAE